MRGASDSDRPTAGPVQRCAWAKVNLYLHLTDQRPDGYHDIDSLVVFAGIGDHIEIAPAERLELRVCGPRRGEVPEDEGNLALRAALALAERCRPAGSASVRLEKHLPAAAGLGGGSADAAAVIAGLMALWGVAPSQDELQDIALGLGADVPVCLLARPAFASGVGERLTRAPALPPAWLVLANPGVALPTAKVFAARRGTFSTAAPWCDTLADLPALAARLASLGNDLEAPARELAPEVGEALSLIAAQDGVLLARMSGSGATCFGLLAEREAAEAAAAAVAAERPRWWVRAAPLLHGPLDRWRGPPTSSTSSSPSMPPT